jgi:hypothetical protein
MRVVANMQSNDIVHDFNNGLEPCGNLQLQNRSYRCIKQCYEFVCHLHGNNQGHECHRDHYELKTRKPNLRNQLSKLAFRFANIYLVPNLVSDRIHLCYYRRT